MYKSAEKRKYKRIETPYIARFRMQQHETQDMVLKEWDMVYVNNLGAGGISFYTRRSLEISTALDLKIGPPASTSIIKCIGKVVRTKRHLDTSIFCIAIEFTVIEKHIKDILNKTAFLVNPDIQFSI